MYSKLNLDITPCKFRSKICQVFLFDLLAFVPATAGC